MNIGVQTGNWYVESKPYESIKYIGQCGFNSIDYNINNLFDETFNREKLTSFFDKSITELEEYYSELKKATAEMSVHISQMHGIFPFYYENNERLNEYIIECNKKMIAVCGYLGCKFFVLHPWTGLEISKDMEKEINFSVFDKLISVAKENNVTICLENVFRHKNGKCIEAACSAASEAVSYIDKLNEMAGEEVFGFCLDTGHANLLARNIYQFIKSLGCKLKALHIHDNNGIEDLHMIPFTQFGIDGKNRPMDWDGFIKGLREISFNGTLSFETFNAIDNLPTIAKTDGLKLVSKIGEYFIKEIEG